MCPKRYTPAIKKKKAREEMKKKFYLKPATEVLEIMDESDLLAGTNYPNCGDGSDEYEFPVNPGGEGAGGLQ